MRQVVLDTETTGLDPSKGHRIIEIGCVELYERRLTGKSFHTYLNPQREVEAGAYAVHGISTQFLADKPLFSGIAEELLVFLQGAELIIHNAPFDLGFLNHELSRTGRERTHLSTLCTVVDTLVLARQQYPGKKNSLDALCQRLGVDNSRRDLHGALLDAEILAQVYLAMTSGQDKLFEEVHDKTMVNATREVSAIRQQWPETPVIYATDAECKAHEEYLQKLIKTSGIADLAQHWQVTQDSTES